MAEEAKKSAISVKGLFEGLSAAQLTAGALAAVTSMLLSARIGIAGSVIGVAVGSIVSTVASQVYKRFLEQSASKLRDLREGDGCVGEDDEGDEGEVGGAGEMPEAPDNGAPAGQLRTRERLAVQDVSAGAGAQGASEGVSFPQTAAAQVRAEHPAHRATTTPHLGDASLAQDVTAQHVREKRAHDRRVQRSVIVVSVVSALVAVAVTAGFVELTTQGQGLGAKPAAIEQVVSSSQGASANSEQSAEGGTQQSAAATDGSANANGSDAQKGDQSGSQTGSSSQGSSASGSQSGQSQTETGQGQTGSSASSGSSTSGSSSNASLGHDSSSGESTASGSSSGTNEGSSSAASGSSSTGSSSSSESDK